MAKPNIYDVTATGSTTPRDIRDRFADVINVRDFGAVGDGVTDDTAAIQAAIVAVKNAAVLVNPETQSKTGGPALFFPYGVYLVSEQLRINYPQQLTIISHAAIIRAMAPMQSVLYINGSWRERNVLSNIVIDMNNLADIGIHVGGDTRRVIFDKVSVIKVGKIVNSGDTVPIGIYLSAENGGDGFGHRLENVSISEPDTTFIVSENYNALGLKIDTPDVNGGVLSISNMITGIELNAGNFRATTCDVGYYAAPETDNWERVVHIIDNEGDTVFTSLGLHNGKTGYWIADEKAVTIGTLHYIQAVAETASTSATSEALTPKTPIVFNVASNSQVQVGCYAPYYWYLRNYKVVTVYNRKAIATADVLDMVGQSALVRINHTIAKPENFKIVDAAFHCDNYKASNLISKAAANLADGYYLLGYMTFYGSGGCTVDLSVSSTSARFNILRLGPSFYIDRDAKLYGSTAAKYACCLGTAISDPLYGFEIYPLYLHKDLGSNLFTNVRIGVELRSPTCNFYRSPGTTAESLLVANPELLVTKTFGD